jgi:trehalose 6-phosphate synthase
LSRLIIVSNRVNPPENRAQQAAGGLAVAISAALREYSGFWFGWSGDVLPEFTGQIRTRTVDEVTVCTVDLDEADYQEYYNGYANGTLWPLFHSRIDLTAYERAYGQGYERVNRRFADALAPMIESGDLIWVHDRLLPPYPLARAPAPDHAPQPCPPCAVAVRLRPGGLPDRGMAARVRILCAG